MNLLQPSFSFLHCEHAVDAWDSHVLRRAGSAFARFPPVRILRKDVRFHPDQPFNVSFRQSERVDCKRGFRRDGTVVLSFRVF